MTPATVTNLNGGAPPRRRATPWLVLALAAALAAATSGARAWAAASEWARTDQTELRLVSAVAGVGDERDLRLGLHIRLAPGWKTYWRSPGAAGFPVTVDWSGSRNLAAAEMSWPAPHRFSLFGLDTFGYADEVVFPIALRPERPGEPVALAARVDYLVCQEICIPYQTTLGLDLPAGPATPSEYLQLIDRFAARVPGDGAAQGLALERVSAADGPPARLEVVARSTFPFADPDLFVEGPPGLYFAAPKVAFGDGGRVARLSIAVTADPDAPPLVGSRLTLTLVDEAPGGVRGLERAVTPQAGPPAAALSSVLLLALLGGLILNLMPCVLPVLSLKLLGVVGHGGGPGRAVRVSFLASAAGVLFSFLALAGALAGLKAAGVTIGWGIQFQQPLFLIAMTLLLTLFACNLWGWFEVPLPGWLGDLALLAPPAGDGPRHGLAGHFMTGALATLLATPCSAPFVGTAIGFALARGTGEIFAVFAALGLGLALPYLAVAAAPSLATWLPRPGRWMATLRRVLGLALAGTAVWLLTVLAAQLDAAAAYLVGGLMLAAAGALWARRRLPPGLRLASPAAVGLFALAAFLAPGQMLPRDAGWPAATEAAAPDGIWQPFDEPRIAQLVQAGKLVFVDVTADWCITCQVNKKLVLEAGETARRLAASDLVAMRADWTRPDERIAAYLASFGRYGIPFDAVYGPGAPAGLALPELLSERAVLDALAAARGG